MGYKELIDKYKLLQGLMDEVPDVIYFKDKKGRLIMVNRAHAQGLGLKPAEVVGKTDFDIFPKKRAEKMAKDDQYVMRTGKPIIDKVERATRPDGVDNYVTTTKIPRYDDKGKVIGLVGITRDITHRMQLERLTQERSRIEKKLQALEELNRLKAEFISVASHEIRTPLAIAQEAIMLVLDGAVGSLAKEQKKLLLKARNSIERLKEIIGELLDISRIESGEFKLHYGLINLNDLLEDSAGFLKRLAKEKSLSLEYQLPKSQVNIFLDAAKINQVLSNLITNAIKFTEEGGKITVELKTLESKVRIGVIDTGIGIAKQDLPKLFDKFTQFAKLAGSERRGVGLGLSITKSLVEKHGGEIWAESKLGVGSKFYFTLPRLYTLSVLDSQIRAKINDLLNKGVCLYLINLSIINLKSFKERIKVEPKDLFKNLEIAINTILKGFSHPQKEKPQIVLQDYQRGQWGIVFPQATEEKAARLCGLLKEKIKNYLIKNKVKNVFINLGILSYPSKGSLSTTQPLLASLYLKKIYIGAEVRRFKRILYKTNIEVGFTAGKTELPQTVDISRGGLCFASQRRLETDSPLNLSLKLPKTKEPIVTRARLVWIKEIEQFPKTKSKRYKIGVEFINLKDKDKKALAEFIKSY